MANENVPLWLSCSSSAVSATKKIADKELRYKINLFTGWKKYGKRVPGSSFPEDVYRGEHPMEWLIISYMDSAIPGHNMANWVEFPLSIVGFPAFQMVEIDPAPVLKNWQRGTGSSLYLLQSSCDEMLTYTGSAVSGNDKARLFMLLLRKQNFAWKIFLSIHSSRADNQNELLVMREDHMIASQVFGSLKLKTS